MKVVEKDFRSWIKQKEIIHKANELRNIEEGQVWWCAFGENIGVEINGKGENFIRPAIVFKKISRYSFMAIPITTEKHTGNWYIPLKSRDAKNSLAVLSQARILSTARIDHEDKAISVSDLELVRSGFHRLYCVKNRPSRLSSLGG